MDPQQPTDPTLPGATFEPQTPAVPPSPQPPAAQPSFTPPMPPETPQPSQPPAPELNPSYTVPQPEAQPFTPQPVAPSTASVHPYTTPLTTTEAAPQPSAQPAPAFNQTSPVVGHFEQPSPIDHQALFQPDSYTAFGTHHKSKHRKRFSKALALVLIPLLLLGGGSAGAYFGVIMPNKPENVMAKAITNLLSDPDGIGSFSVSVNIQSKNPSMVDNNVVILTNGGVDGDNNVRADTRVEFSILKLTSSVIVRPQDKTLYVKINELPSLLQLVGGGQDLGPLKDLAQKLNQNWVRINVADLKDAGVLNNEQASSAEKCINAYADFFTNKKRRLQDAFLKAYNQHAFVGAKKAGSDVIENERTSKFEITIDDAKSTEFSKEVDSQLADVTKTFDQACGSTPQEVKQPTAAVDQAIEKDKTGPTYAWVSHDKRLKKIETKISGKESNTSVVVSFNDKAFDTSKPAKVTTLKELQSLIDQSKPYIPGSTGGGELTF